MGLEQQAGWNYVQSIYNISKLLNQVSKAWKILTTRTTRTYDTRFSNLELCSIDCTYSDGCWSPTIFFIFVWQIIESKILAVSVFHDRNPKINKTLIKSAFVGMNLWYIPAGITRRSPFETSILIHSSFLSRTSKNPDPSAIARVSSSSWICSRRNDFTLMILYSPEFWLVYP